MPSCQHHGAGDEGAAAPGQQAQPVVQQKVNPGGVGIAVIVPGLPASHQQLAGRHPEAEDGQNGEN